MSTKEPDDAIGPSDKSKRTRPSGRQTKADLLAANDELVAANDCLRERVGTLDAANTELTNLIAAADIPAVLLDTGLSIRRFTQPTAGLFNFSEADIGRPLRDIAPTFEDDTLFADCEAVLGQPSPIEKEIHTDDGHCYLRRILPYRGTTGRIEGIVVSFVDITDRIGAEAKIRHLASVLRISHDAIIISTLDGRITGWNQGAINCYGYSEAEALELEFRDIVPAQYRPKAVAAVEQVLARMEVPTYESQRLTKDGRVVDVEVTLTVLTDKNGSPVELARTERDITARLQREAEIQALQTELERRVRERTSALHERDYRIRAILDATPDAIVTIDGNGTIEGFNKAAQTMFGYSADEALGSNVSILMGEPYRSEHAGYLSRYAQTGEARLLGKVRDLTGRRRDGTEFPIQLSATPVNGQGLFTGIIRDVTEQRALQEEIVRVAAAEQRRIGEELHDGTQQELTGLGLLAQHLAEASVDTGSGELRQIAVKLANGIAETNRHVRQLARGLVPVAIDAEGLMAALSTLAERTEEEAGIACRFDCPATVDVADDMLALHLYRIAQEAVNNAVKHADATTITIELRNDPEGVALSIRDDGVGVSPAAGSTGGLGLRLMAHRCGLIAGTLEVSRTEPGTEVLCRVPLVNRAK